MALAPNLFILTGAPGSGKTAILSRLRSEFRCVDEPAREVLAEQRATGGIGTWDQDRFLFVHLLLQRSIEKYQAGRRSGRTVVFDRGIPDCVVYALRGTVALAEARARWTDCSDAYQITRASSVNASASRAEGGTSVPRS